MPTPTPKQRQWLYGIVVALLPVLVAFKLIDPDQLPLWLTLAGAVLGTGAAGTALVAVTKQRKNGILE
jgi:hypothetical protein